MAFSAHAQFDAFLTVHSLRSGGVSSAIWARLTSRNVVGLTPASVFTGCTSYVISRKFREKSAMDVTVPMVRNDPQNHGGIEVICGGRILEVTNDSTGSRLMVLETVLDNPFKFFFGTPQGGRGRSK